MTDRCDTLIAACTAVLNAGSPADKVAAARQAVSLLRGEIISATQTPHALPDRPARPKKPELKPPADMPRRRLGSANGRATLLHAVAHIEFNAIDLAFDMAARFATDIAKEGLDPAAFLTDWITVGGEEAYHFGLVIDRLRAYGVSYGDLPAHDGLWEAAENTRHDVAARLAIAPMILEARGLDVTPGMIEKLVSTGDQESAETLAIIYRDEIGHVACGQRWFEAVCNARNADPIEMFEKMRTEHFNGPLKPPFNHDARSAAGMDRVYYEKKLCDEPN